MTPGSPDALVCAVDVGTSAVRAALVAADGTIVRSVRSKRLSNQGAVTFDPTGLWSELAGALRELTDGSDHEMASLAIAGHVGTVFVDEGGATVGDGYGWADISGVAALASRWSASGPELRTVGRPAITGGALPLLGWLAEHDPQMVSRVRWVLTPKDFLLHRLGAVAVTDATTAAYSLALDVRSVRWDSQLITASGLDVDQFPSVHRGTEVVGFVSPLAARTTGLREGTLLVAGGPDGTVGAAAVLGTRTGVVADVAGTTDVLTSVTSSPDDTVAGAVLNPYLVDGFWSRGGATGMTGGAVAHWARLLGFGQLSDVPSSVLAQMERLAPGCDGLSVLPTITGSRFPDWSPSERGAVWGMGERHNGAHVLRAAQEAASFVVRGGVDALAGPGDPPMLLAGGTAKSNSLAQLRADVLGRTVLACTEPDVSLCGAALLAHVGAGTHPDLDQAQKAMGPTARRFDPDEQRAARYDALYAEWCEARRMLHAVRGHA